MPKKITVTYSIGKENTYMADYIESACNGDVIHLVAFDVDPITKMPLRRIVVIVLDDVWQLTIENEDNRPTFSSC